MDTNERVPKGPHNKIAGDGRGSVGMTQATPRPHGVVTEEGRHFVGRPLANMGAANRGQRAPVGNSPTTGARPEVSYKPPYVPDAKDTSLDAEQMIKEAPTPFKNNMTTAHIPAPVNEDFGRTQTAGLPADSLYGTAHGGYVVTEVGCANTRATKDDLSAIGETELPSGYNDVNYFRGAGCRETGQPGTPAKRASSRDVNRMRQRP